MLIIFFDMVAQNSSPHFYIFFLQIQNLSTRAMFFIYILQFHVIKLVVVNKSFINFQMSCIISYCRIIITICTLSFECYSNYRYEFHCNISAPLGTRAFTGSGFKDCQLAPQITINFASMLRPRLHPT